jgi:Xaa-Pro dipeptidase
MMDPDYRRKLVPKDEIEFRINRFRKEMAHQGIESSLVISRTNYHYLSGTSQFSILYLPVEDEPILFVRRDIERAKEESSLSEIVSFKSPKQLPELIKEHGGTITRTIGIEMDVLPALDFLRYQKIFSGSEFLNSSPGLMRCRMKKTPFEIEQIKAACLIAEKMFQAGRHLLRPGISEIEFAAVLDVEARKRGHEGIVRIRGLNVEAYTWHVLAGGSGHSVSDLDTPSSGRGLSPAFPNGASARKIKTHEPIMVDFPICYNGYLADQTRMFCIGELPDKFRKAYEFCLEVEKQTIENARPGVNCEDLYLLGKKMAQERGYEQGYLGLDGKKSVFVGHGLGLEVNETPVFGLGQKYALETGVVVAVEPKVVFPHEGVVGTENMYHITDDGYEKLTTIEDRIFEI